MTLHFKREVDKLKKMVLTETDFVEEGLKRTIQALRDLDTQTAGEMIAADDRLDQMELEIEEESLKILALHQPVATDLRFIISVIKLNNDLERIGDLTANIASSIKVFAKKPQVMITSRIFEMADIAEHMVRHTFEALVNMDTEMANEVCARDNDIDALHRDMYTYIYSKIREDVENTEIYMQQIRISRYLERIADHATNIAEDIVYMVSGKISRHNTEL